MEKAIKIRYEISLLSVVSYLLFIVVAVSFYQYLNVNQNNECLMTFMYQTPNFIPVPLPKKVETNFNKYKIYAYKEGKKDDKFNHSDFNGFPVLFIPGSSGSHKQVRSFASISMNFNRHYVTKAHLDFFAIDFNEEFSGVHGHYLHNQTIFLNQAIKIIKRLYYKQKSVKLIVIAHSFGGIIFKGLINLPSFKMDDILLLLTLATPHQKSVFPFDSSFHTYYSQIQTNTDNYKKYQQIAKISIGGGLNDNLVRSDLTNTQEQNQWSLTSNSLPEVWVPADHKCIVWCKQLVKKLVHLIYDLLEERSQDEKMQYRNLIIEHHLNHRSTDRLTPRHDQLSAKFNRLAKRIEISERLFVFSKAKVIDTVVYQFKFVPDTFYSILSTNLHKSDWLFACKPNLDECDKITNLVNQALPSNGELNGLTKKNHFIIDSNYHLSQGYSELVLQVGTSTLHTRFQIERIINGRRDREIELPSVFNRLLWLFSPLQTLLRISIAEQSTYYNLTLNGFDQIWHNYNLKLEIGRCYEDAKENIVLNMNVPWYKDDRLILIRNKKNTQFNTALSLNVPKYKSEDDSKIRLQLHLDPYCEYRLSAKYSIRGTITQLFRHYSHLFLPITASIMLSTFAAQLKARTYQNELLPDHLEYYSSLKSIIAIEYKTITLFGLVPTLPYLVDQAVSTMAFQLGFDQYLQTNLVFLSYTLHDSFIHQLHSNYLVYFFVFFILIITIRLLSAAFSFIINRLAYLNGTHLYLQLRNQISSLPPKSSHKYLYSKSILLAALLLFIYLNFVFYALVLVYLTRIIVLSIQSTLHRQKIGLTRSSTRIYVDVSRFLLLILAFLPLIPKFIIWFMTNEFIFDKTTILFKIAFTVSLVQLMLSNGDQEPSCNKNNTLLIYLTRFASLFCLCFGHLDYSMITIVLSLIIILMSSSSYEFRTLRLEQSDKKLK